MNDKAILENDGTVNSVPDIYKNQEMYDKAVDNYLYALKLVSGCYKKCDKAVNTYLSIIIFVPEPFMTQRM